MIDKANKLVGLTYFRGRVALYAILRALNIGKGDEVITQAFTCVAVPEAIMATGANPVYVDVEPGRFSMNVDDLKLKVSFRTRAIVVQHTYGIPASMDEIVLIAEKKGIPVIEDCCHTFNSSYKGKAIGTFGIGSFYSYEWGKPLVAGIGGSIQGNNEQLMEKIYINYDSYKLPNIITQIKIELQYYGFRLFYRPTFYWPVRTLFHWLGAIGLAESNYNPIGEVADDFNLRMSPLVKKRFLQKIKNIQKQTQHSRWVSEQYRMRIYSAAISHPVLNTDDKITFSRYPLLVRNKRELLSKARQACVEVADWYATPVHPLTGKLMDKVQYKWGSCPNAEACCNQVVSLPVHIGVKQFDIDRAVDFLIR